MSLKSLTWFEPKTVRGKWFEAGELNLSTTKSPNHLCKNVPQNDANKPNGYNVYIDLIYDNEKWNSELSHAWILSGLFYIH
jgi:hypothetical protein